MMLEYTDFYDIAEYGNEHWKGSFTPREIACNAYEYKAEYDYSICSPFVHFTEEGITCQIIIQLSKAKYEVLYNAGHRYLKGTIKGKVYDHQLDETNYSVALNRITILNVNLSKETLMQGSYQHIVLKLTLDPSTNA